jgi:hypothetical protein
MPEIIVLGKELGKPLNRRRRVTVELPEFILRAIHCRVDEANVGDETGEQVSFNDMIEWLLVTEVTLKKMPILEQSIPGFTAAMFVWLMEATYSPDTD